MEWKHVSLKSKLMLFILVGVALVLISSTAIIISTVTTQEEQLAYEQSIEKARSYANQFDIDMRSNQAIGQTIASTLSEYESNDRDEVNNMLYQLLEDNPNLIGTYVCYEPDAFDENDHLYANTYGHDDTGRFIPYWNRLRGSNTTLDPLLNYDTLDYYQVPKNTKNTVLTEPYYYEGVFIVSFASPIIKNDEFIGIGGVDVGLNYIDEIVNQVKTFETGYAFMTGNTGILISHPTNKEWVGSKTLYDFNVPEIDLMAEEIRKGNSGYIRTIDPITNKKSVMFYEPVKTSNYSFILVVPEEEMLAGVTDLRHRLMIISSISTLFMGAVAALIARSISRPINEIVRDFKYISDEAVGGKLDIRADTEVDVDFKKIPEGLNDILEALENAKQLREEMENVVNSSPVIVFKWRAEKNWPVEFVSKNISQFGYSQNDFEDGTITYGDMVVPEDLEIVESNLAEAIKNGETEFTCEYRIITKSGEIRWVDERTFIGRYAEGNVKDLQGIIVNIDERKRAEEALLKIEDIRKKEIHHRIKNNLQVISTLLFLESEKFKDMDVLDAFKNSRDRVRTMALVHEKLYQSEDMESIDFADYSKNLINYLSQSYVLRKSDVNIELEVEDVFLGVDTAVPLGIIINELVSNALKYAFEDKGQITIELKKFNSEYKLIVSDNGIGLPENLDVENTDSLGLQLVYTLVEQIDGKIDLDTTSGTKFTITFTEDK
ncbi:histidine kinase dimerization/phosphoacceptor domain -containing protein [Methanohalophilus levihalophilus]|nr:histidine kinase dimerization/phosphoacceptor domain -containing protein [Methanohalophilus levihalophilus]